MNIYLGLFLVAFSALSLEVTLVRILSVTTWYHLSFFAISTAMLGMTAGATRVYLQPDKFRRGTLEKALSVSSIHLALSIPVTLVLLCLVPLGFYKSVMSLFALILTTAACALPFYFAGTIASAVMTKFDLPIGKLYASDLIGASLGCLFVLGGLEIMDGPSLLLLCSSTSALGGLCFAWKEPPRRHRRVILGLIVIFIFAGIINSLTLSGIRPVIVKGVRIEPAVNYILERWNSFSRVAVYPGILRAPQYWGPSPLAPRDPVYQFYMFIDGEAGTIMRRFNSPKDIEHLRYDVTNIGYHLGRKGKACVIGVGGGRDIQSALLFGHEHVTGVEVNPIFLDLLQGEFKNFARIGGNPAVTLVKAEARSYLSRESEQYSMIQMSLTDTWASTGAGAFSLSENSLYTVEAWTVFLNRLTDNGVFTVSRWHSPKRIGETGRIVALAIGTLLRNGIKESAKHIALVTAGNVSTLLLSRGPFSAEDINKLSEACEHYQFQPVILPGRPPAWPFFIRLLSARTYTELVATTNNAELNYSPTTDENPYFFNMLRLTNILSELGSSEGVVRGNLIATLTLVVLLLTLVAFVIATIVLPLMLRAHSKPDAAVSSRTLFYGALYFSLIGAAFMLVEIALIQRLTVLLSHPTYALGILLFTIIASTGIGSLLSERLPLVKYPWLYIYPVVTAVCIIGVRFLLSNLLRNMVTADLFLKILASIAIIFPMGLLMGMFFPTGMRLAKSVCPSDTPWFWALNGILGVLCSVVAVFLSIYVSISVNFYIAATCYTAVLIPITGLWRQVRRT